MFKLDKNSGLLIEELRNGFLGREVVYILWNVNRQIAYSYDKKTWKMCSWADKLVDIP